MRLFSSSFLNQRKKKSLNVSFIVRNAMKRVAFLSFICFPGLSQTRGFLATTRPNFLRNTFMTSSRRQSSRVKRNGRTRRSSAEVAGMKYSFRSIPSGAGAVIGREGCELRVPVWVLSPPPSLEPARRKCRRARPGRVQSLHGGRPPM